MTKKPAVWFPTIRTNTGTDIFTECIVKGLNSRGIKAGITWLPLRAEYAPWSVLSPKPPEWATVLHVNTWLHPSLIPKNIPVVATLHHSIHDPDLRPYKGWLRDLYHKYWIATVEIASIRRANSIVAVSQFAAKSAQQHLIASPTTVIPNGVDIQFFTPPPQRQPHHPFRLLYVGSWMKRKGVDLLPAIMRELGSDFELRYTGGAAAQRSSSKMPLNTIDIGRLNKGGVLEAMQSADALLFPSRSEGLPLTVLEAMACGLPVIATRGSALVEVIKDGYTGILCSRDDTVEFAEAARTLAKIPEQYTRMGINAHKIAINEYSINKMVDTYIDLYKNLISSNMKAKNSGFSSMLKKVQNQK